MEMIMETQYILTNIETFIDELDRATSTVARHQVIKDHLVPWWDKQDQDKNFTGERDGHD